MITGLPEWQTRLLAAVEQYSQLGIPIFPTHSINSNERCTCGKDCGRDAGKHPVKITGLIEHGFKDATTNPVILKKMFPGGNIFRNIGMPTGSVSGIIVVDIDGEAGERKLEELQSIHGVLPETRTVKTSKGRHIHFKAPAYPLTSFSNSDIKIDLRADGGYVLLPSSRHISGREYEVLKDIPAVAAPDWLIEWLAGDARTKTKCLVAPISLLGEPPPHIAQLIANSEFPKFVIGDIGQYDEGNLYNSTNEASLKEALIHIDANCNRDIWLSILAGIKSLHFDNAWPQEVVEDCAHEWSKRGTKAGQYNASDFHKTWGSIRERSNNEIKASIRTVLYHARQGGWNGQLSYTVSSISNSSQQSTSLSPLVQVLQKLKAISLDDFLNHRFPPREFILDPIIPTQGLVMLYAVRGVGKTYVSLSVALSVATAGSILGDKWRTNKARKVLFVDGEMPAVVLQARLSALTGNSKKLPESDYLRIITPDMQDSGIPDLATPEGQKAIDEHLEDVELLILDNLSSLLRQGKENEAESWVSIQSWLLSLRKRGISVLLVHHANKSGGQRGTSKREDLLDTVVTLKHPSNYNATEGARFEVHYEKARGFWGDKAKPFEAHLVATNDEAWWAVKEIEESQYERLVTMQAEGLTQRDMAKELKCSAAKVNRLLQKAKKTG